MRAEPNRWPVRAALSSAAATAATLCLAARQQPSSPQQQPSISSPQEVADALDTVMQSQFIKTNNRFGQDRTVNVLGHRSAKELTSAPLPAELQKRERAADSAHYPYVVQFLHLVSFRELRRIHSSAGAQQSVVVVNPAREPEPIDPKPETVASRAIGTGDHLPDLRELLRVKSLRQAAQSQQAPDGGVLARLTRGEPAFVWQQDWLVVFRPIRAFGSNCTSCHSHITQGQTLAAMVYMVKTHAMQAEAWPKS